MTGNYLSGRYAGRLGVKPLMRSGTMLALLGVALLIAAMAYAPFVPAAIFVPMFFIALGNGLVLPSTIASAVTVRGDLAGAASGLTGALQMGLGAAATVVVASALQDSAMPMVVAMTVCSLIAATGYAIARRYQ